MTKTKLAITSRGFFPDTISGRETVIYNIWKQAQTDYDVHLICGWKTNPDYLPKICKAINLSSKNKFLNYFIFYFGCRKYLKNINPDIVLANSIEVPKTSSPTVMIVHDLNFGSAKHFEKKYLIKKKIITNKLKRIDKIIAVSEITKQKIINLGIPADKVIVIHNGVDAEKFIPIPTSNKTFTVVYPSRILYGKGQHVAIEAIKLLSPEIINNLRLIITGFEHDKEYCKKMKGLSEGFPIEFTTDVTDIVPYYQKADLIIYPTIMEEGFGYTAIEAMACEKPVIYSNFSAIREATGNIGIAFNAGDASELAEGIKKLYCNKELRLSLGKQGREYVLNHYRWHTVFERYQTIFNELLGK